MRTVVITCWISRVQSSFLAEQDCDHAQAFLPRHLSDRVVEIQSHQYVCLPLSYKLEPLCEILPEGIPSLALNLAVLISGNYTPEVQQRSLDKLGLKDMPIGDNLADTLWYAANHKGTFPGASAFQAIAKLERAKNEFQSSNQVKKAGIVY